jgi:hypothetical protein
MKRITREQLIELIRQIAKTRVDEIGCDEAYALLDAFAEAAARGESPEKLLPQVALHLELCRDCFEEYDALLAVIQSKAPSV